MRVDSINKSLLLENSFDRTKIKQNGEGFSAILKNSLDEVNNLQVKSRYLKEKAILGEVDNLHDVSIMAEKADIALQVTMAIRGKIVEAYKEILRMQV